MTEAKDCRDSPYRPYVLEGVANTGLHFPARFAGSLVGPHIRLEVPFRAGARTDFVATPPGFGALSAPRGEANMD